MYKIIRHYFNRNVHNQVIATNLTLDEAKAHCDNPETSSNTCKSAKGIARTKKYGPWFDGFTQC